MHAPTLLAFSLVALLARSMPVQDQERAQVSYERRSLGTPGDTRSLNYRVGSTILRRSTDKAKRTFGPRVPNKPKTQLVKSEGSGVESVVDDSFTTNTLQTSPVTEELIKPKRPLPNTPAPAPKLKNPGEVRPLPKPPGPQSAESSGSGSHDTITESTALGSTEPLLEIHNSPNSKKPLATASETMPDSQKDGSGSRGAETDSLQSTDSNSPHSISGEVSADSESGSESQASRRPLRRSSQCTVTETSDGNNKIKVVGTNWPRDFWPTEEVIMVEVHSTPKVRIEGKAEAMAPIDFKIIRTGAVFQATFVVSKKANPGEKTAAVLIGEWITKLFQRTVVCRGG